MATLQEIMAKKKAEAAAPMPAPAQPPATKAPEILAVLEEEAKKPEAPLATTKPLSFAEKMALKRASEANTSQAPALAGNVGSLTVVSSITQEEPSPKVEAPITSPAPSAEMRENQAADIPASNDTTTPKQDADPATAQAYADIATRIQALNELSDVPLENAMKELKKALMANPNAVSLMLDSDYGQMVIALRRLTKQDQVEAETEKKKGGNGRKKKTIDFTNPDEVQAVFDEL